MAFSYLNRVCLIGCFKKMIYKVLIEYTHPLGLLTFDSM